VDVNKLDESWARTRARWDAVKRVWEELKLLYHTVLAILAIPLMVAFLGLVGYLIWDVSFHAKARHDLGVEEFKQIKWYLGFLVASWVIGKLWRKKPKPPVETDDGVLHEESVQGSEPEGHQARRNHRNHRRVQRRS
jgi:hypothetical protein